MLSTFTSLLLAFTFYKQARTACDQFDELRALMEQRLATDEGEDDVEDSAS
jgi:hypothetical protein